MSSSTIVQLISDWKQESSNLLAVLAELSEAQWDLDTPALGWTIRDQVAHLDWTEQMLLLAISDQQQFDLTRQTLMDSGEGFVDRAAHQAALQAPAALKRSWMDTQVALSRSFANLEEGQRVHWFGPSMSVSTALSARIMELFAHGQDIRDALGIAPVGSIRLRHIAHLAITARDFAFTTNALPVPARQFRIELEYGDQRWTWGPEESTERVVGQALDFALLATRRRHRVDCAVQAHGEQASRWLEIIQSYAGSPGPGRPPLAHQQKPNH